ncbi:MAG TPA: hypothetical protein VN445_07185 [Rectinemataceae bacterium]|nr:hypothetical protein [Rectinemataceae bacterium]
MEEIKGTEALEREILDDATRKAERIVQKAKEEAERLKANSAATLDGMVTQLEARKLEKIAQMKREAFSKMPLEKTRLRARFIDGAMRASVAKFMDALDDAALGAWCLSGLKKRSSLLAGRKLRMSYRGIDASSLREMGKLLGSGVEISASVAEDGGAPQRGIAIESLDGSMVMKLGEKQLEERLMDEYRGELASALFPATAERG